MYKRQDQRLAVSLRAERRIHPRIGSVRANIRLGQGKVVRRDLRIDPRAQRLARADQRDRLCRADMLEQDPVSYTHLDVYKRQAQTHAHAVQRGGEDLILGSVRLGTAEDNAVNHDQRQEQRCV